MDEDRSRNTSLDESLADRTRTPRPSDEFEGVLIGGRYLLKRRIGEGGFGAVYLAADERFDSPVAVKLLFGRTSESEVTFRKEAKLIRRFKHPSVVEVYDYGVDDGVAFIVMEFLNGIPLHKYFERQGRRLPNETIRKFVTEIGSALENAHAKNLVHRDLKPQNVMLVDEGQPTERFVLLDLGMATKTDAARDETIGNPMANSGLTPQYAPPEQFRQQSATHLSDIYSFGTILYHLVSGRLPFPLAGSLGQLWHAVEHDAPPLFAEAAPDRRVPEQIEALIRQCLEKKPENRPQSMRELRERFLKAIEPRSPAAIVEWASGAGPTLAIAGAATDPQSTPTRRAAELTSGSRAGPGTATLPVSGSATLPVSGSATSPPTAVWPPTGWRTVERPVGRRKWFVLGSAGLLAVVVAGALALVLSGRSPLPAAPSVAIEVPEQPWTLDLGRPRSFDMTVTRQSAFDGPVAVTVRDLPDHVTAEVSSEATDHFRVTISSTVEAASRDATLRLVATAGQTDVERTLPLRLVWMPPEQFFTPGKLDDGSPCEIVSSRRTGWNFYERLDRVLPDGSRVPFVLVLDESNRDAPPRPFYILRNKVWNGLFEAFADEQADPITTDWKRTHPDEEPQPADPAWQRLPVVDVSALDAVRFARWLGGEQGDLPSRDQWRTASGFYEYDLAAERFRDDRWQEWKNGPFKGERVACGTYAPGWRLPLVLNGHADEKSPMDDVSPRYFVRDMASNGFEWTSDLVPEGRIALDTPRDRDVFVTGWTFQSSGPLTYAQLSDPEGTMIGSVGGSDSVTGFRVVIESE